MNNSNPRDAVIEAAIAWAKPDMDKSNQQVADHCLEDAVDALLKARATPPTPVSTTPADVMCLHGWAQDVACDECGRSGFRWIGINAEGDNKLIPIEITGVWLVRKGGENDPKARVEVHVELPDGWHHVITEPLGANFSHAVSPCGIRQSPLSEWVAPASPLTAPAHKFVGVGAGELGMSVCESCGELERSPIHSLKFRAPTAEGEAEVPAGLREKIASAAIRKDGLIYPCWAHTFLEIKRMNLHAPDDVMKHAEQGFVTNTGRFVDRREALSIACMAGQVIHKHRPLDELMSEDTRALSTTTAPTSVSEQAQRAARTIFVKCWPKEEPDDTETIINAVAAIIESEFLTRLSQAEAERAAAMKVLDPSLLRF